MANDQLSKSTADSLWCDPLLLDSQVVEDFNQFVQEQKTLNSYVNTFGVSVHPDCNWWVGGLDTWNCRCCLKVVNHWLEKVLTIHTVSLKPSQAINWWKFELIFPLDRLYKRYEQRIWVFPFIPSCHLSVFWSVEHDTYLCTWKVHGPEPLRVFRVLSPESPIGACW